ncbi:MAG: hypothetical protein R3195_06755 [Gemmatimonadota bacterium]|nr:hypothetical protein [Gemmatimonadota bacterium]
MTVRWWSRVTAFITLAAAWKLLAPAVADPDLWGHILFGRRTLALGLEREDPFSYLSGDHPWINHEVLSEVAFGFLYDLGGPVALTCLKLAVALATVAIIYRYLIGKGSDPLRAGLLLVAAIFLMIPGFTTVRPQMFSFLFFCLTVLALSRIDDGDDRWLLALPVILAVWINFHGGVLAGVGVMGVWGLARVFEAWTSERRVESLRALARPATTGLACALALLANPYGWGLPRFLLETATVPRPDIIEWQPIDVGSATGVIWVVLTVFAAVTVARSPEPKRPTRLALLATVVLLPLSAVRHVQLFAIALPILIAGDLAIVWRRESAPQTAGRRDMILVGGVTLLAGTALIGLGVRDLTCIRIDPRRAIPFPVRAVEVLRQAEVRGNVATYFDWGEYVIWHLPDVRVGMDGRRETVYPDTIYTEYLRFQHGVEGWRQVIDRPETDLVLFSTTWPTVQLLELEPGWQTVYEDETAAIFARTGSSLADAIRSATPPDVPSSGVGMCVP